MLMELKINSKYILLSYKLTGRVREFAAVIFQNDQALQNERIAYQC